MMKAFIDDVMLPVMTDYVLPLMLIGLSLLFIVGVLGMAVSAAYSLYSWVKSK